jgi:hypothetical protein
MMEERWAARLPMAMFTINVNTGEQKTYGRNGPEEDSALRRNLTECTAERVVSEVRIRVDCAV